MNERELRDGAQVLRARGEVTDALRRELEAVVRWLVFAANLPTSMSPYGKWDDEAAEELLQAWLEERLLRGHLQALLDRARTPDALRRLAKRSLRQWLLNHRRRSYSQNLYLRLQKLLDDPPFVRRQEAARPQDTWWTLESAPNAPLFAKPERELESVAWSLGDFELLRYSEREKLSPLLSAADLRRFAEGLLRRTGCALTLGMMLRALRHRFGLDEPAHEPLDRPERELALAAADAVAEGAVIRRQAKAVLEELAQRQRDVLLGTRAGETLEQLAARHRCAVATIHDRAQADRQRRGAGQRKYRRARRDSEKHRRSFIRRQ